MPLWLPRRHYKKQTCNTYSTDKIMMKTKAAASAALKFETSCSCGKVQLAVETLESGAPSPLRLICYCTDCRGYYETLNCQAVEKGQAAPALLDVSQTSPFLKPVKEWFVVLMTCSFSLIELGRSGLDHLVCSRCFCDEGSRVVDDDVDSSQVSHSTGLCVVLSYSLVEMGEHECGKWC